MNNRDYDPDRAAEEADKKKTIQFLRSVACVIGYCGYGAIAATIIIHSLPHHHTPSCDKSHRPETSGTIPHIPAGSVITINNQDGELVGTLTCPRNTQQTRSNRCTVDIKHRPQ